VRILVALLSLLYVLVLGWHLQQIAAGVEPVGSLGLLRDLTLYFFLPAPFLLLLALALRARVAMMLALLPIALFIVIYAPRFIPRASVAAAPPTLRVLTFNAGAGVGGGAPDGVLSVVQNAQADIVALQEVPARTLEMLRRTLNEQYPYQDASPDVVTFSRYPLADREAVRLRDASYISQAIDILLDDRVVHLTNVHLLRAGPRISGRRSVAAFVRDYEPGLIESQVNELIDQHIRPVQGSQLLTGDFNQTDWSVPYDRITRVLRDSFLEAGTGFGHTYPSSIDVGRMEIQVPLVRIDYIFHSADLAAVSARVGPNGGSDHLPVIADLGFR
jgi:vancomycin resistance protein VanJ